MTENRGVVLPLDLERQAEIGKEKLRFLDELKGQLSTLSLDLVRGVAEAIDHLICETFVAAVRRTPKLAFGECQVFEASNIFSFGQTPCEFLYSRTDLSRRDTLTFAMLPRLSVPGSIGLVESNVDADAGPYSAFSFRFPQFVSADIDYLSALLLSLFTVGYRWLGEALHTAVNQAVTDTQRSLYEFLRVMVDDQEILEGILFSAAAKSEDGSHKDFVLLDAEAVNSCVELAQSSEASTGRNAADLVTEMVVEVVDLEDSAIGPVCEKDEPMLIDLTAGDAYRENPSFHIALRAVWGDAIMCHPIVESGDFRLVVFYLPKHAETLGPFLKENREELRNIASDNGLAISKNLSTMEALRARFASGYNAIRPYTSDFGGFLGAAAREYTR